MLKLNEAGRRVDRRWLWRKLSFEVDEGDRIGIRGPSGSGKTLLLRSMAALDRIDEGSISFEGESLAEVAIPEYRSRVIYLPQTPVVIEGTVEENLRIPYRFEVHRDRELDTDGIRDRLDALGRDAGFLEADAADLSGGEKQIVAFLRVVDLEPRVLLLDEPTANLDEEHARTIESLVEDWLKESRDRAVVWTSHHGERLDRVVDRTIRLGDARGGHE